MWKGVDCSIFVLAFGCTPVYHAQYERANVVHVVTPLNHPQEVQTPIYLHQDNQTVPPQASPTNLAFQCPCHSHAT